MTRRAGSDPNISSSPLPAVALLLLLLLVASCSLHGAAAARLLPPAAAAVPRHRPLVHQQENGAVRAVATADGLALRRQGGGDELSISEVMGAAAAAAEPAEEAACGDGDDLEEANDADEECAQRRLLRDAHLDYIYTQHNKGGRP